MATENLLRALQLRRERKEEEERRRQQREIQRTGRKFVMKGTTTPFQVPGITDPSQIIAPAAAPRQTPADVLLSTITGDILGPGPVGGGVQRITPRVPEKKEKPSLAKTPQERERERRTKNIQAQEDRLIKSVDLASAEFTRIKNKFLPAEDDPEFEAAVERQNKELEFARKKIALREGELVKFQKANPILGQAPADRAPAAPARAPAKAPARAPARAPAAPARGAQQDQLRQRAITILKTEFRRRKLNRQPTEAEIQEIQRQLK